MATVTLRVKVIGFQPDNDNFTGEQFTGVVLAVQSHLPRPPPEVQASMMPSPRTIVWKHIMHIFIPMKHWNDQYRMWQEYELKIEDTGAMSLTPARHDGA